MNSTNTNFKNIYYKTLKAWPYVIVSIILFVSIAAVINLFSEDVFKVETVLFSQENKNPLASTGVSLAFNLGKDNIMDIVTLKSDMCFEVRSFVCRSDPMVRTTCSASTWARSKMHANIWVRCIERTYTSYILVMSFLEESPTNAQLVAVSGGLHAKASDRQQHQRTHKNTQNERTTSKQNEHGSYEILVRGVV